MHRTKIVSLLCVCLLVCVSQSDDTAPLYTHAHVEKHRNHDRLCNTSRTLLIQQGRCVSNLQQTQIHNRCVCVCVSTSRWSVMSKEQVSIGELLLSLDSSELQEAEQVRVAVNQQLCSGEWVRLSVVLMSVCWLYLPFICCQKSYVFFFK